jgi:predicted dehydrogenase
MADAPIKTVLVGYGLAGKVFHAPLLTTTPGFEIKSVVSSRRDEIAADLPGAKAVGGLGEALAGGGVDLVVVASPHDSHYPLAAEAIAHGCHVVVDKPFTLTAAEAEDLRDRARARGVVLSVFQNRRWTADFRTLKRLIAEGELGELVHVEVHFDRFRPIALDRWRERKGPGSGIWFDLGPHLIDQALQLLGRPEAIWTDMSTQREGGGGAVDWFHVVLRYPKARAVLHAGTLTPEPGPMLTIHGMRGSYIKHGLDPQEDQAKLHGMKPGDPGWGVDPLPGVLTRVDEQGRATRTTPEHLPGDYRLYYAGVRDAILGVGSNPVPAEEGVAVMRLIELGMQSAERRCEVAVPAGLFS